jgi:AcrR family transcriptional regulator
MEHREDVDVAAASRTRRTQAQRTAQTRQALLDATLSSLADLGFARTTTTEVAHRAGVSLGALVHHFPAKSELLTAAVGHLLDRRLADFRKAMAGAGMGADRLDTAVDLLWTAFSGPTFVAWAELWVGARTDPELAAAVLTMSDAFRAGCRDVFDELFPPQEYPDPAFLEQGMGFAFAVMEGTALRALVRPMDDAPVQVLKAVAGQLVARSPAGR